MCFSGIDLFLPLDFNLSCHSPPISPAPPSYFFLTSTNHLSLGRRKAILGAVGFPIPLKAANGVDPRDRLWNAEHSPLARFFPRVFLSFIRRIFSAFPLFSDFPTARDITCPYWRRPFCQRRPSCSRTRRVFFFRFPHVPVYHHRWAALKRLAA